MQNRDTLLNHYLKSPDRACINNVFLDEISKRIFWCTGSTYYNLTDPDWSATQNQADLYILTLPSRSH